MAAMLWAPNATITRTDQAMAQLIVGVVPIGRSSGQQRVSTHANKRVKALLHLIALSVVRWCKLLEAYYECRVTEDKNKMLLRNKLVYLLFACVQSNHKYDESYAPALD